MAPLSELNQETASTTPSASPSSSPDFFFSLKNQLQDELKNSRDLLDRWVEEQTQKAKEAGETMKKEVAQRQARIDAASTDLLALQLQGGLTVGKAQDHVEENALADGVIREKLQLEAEQARLLDDIAQYEEELEETKRKTQDLRMEHVHHKERATDAMTIKDEVEASKQVTIDDLTRGIVNYKYLGLDFVKADRGRLRIVFTRVDPLDPEAKFSFELGAEDSWSVESCHPNLPHSVVENLLQKLQKSTDLREFIGGMRRAFQENTLH